MIRGRAAEGLQWYEQILNRASLPHVLESKVLVGAAMMSVSLGDLGRARTGLTRALALAHDAGDADTVAQAEHLFGHVEHGAGDAIAARDRFTRSVAGFRALGIPWGVGNSLNGMAKVAIAIGDDAEAERLLDEATTVLQTCPWFLALVLYRRAILAVRRGNANEAIALVRESLASSGASMTSTQSCTCWSRSRPRQCSRRRHVGSADPGGSGCCDRTHRRHNRRQMGAGDW